MARHLARLVAVTVFLIFVAISLGLGQPFWVLVWGSLALLLGWPFVRTGVLELHYGDAPERTSKAREASAPAPAAPAAKKGGWL